MRALPVLSLLVLSVFASLASAQLTRGFISGTVQDASDAVIAEAAVKITNQATGIEQRSVSNGVGVYRFVAVEPGIYSVEFSKAGFETRRVENIIVGTTQEVTVNQTMAVASATTTVEVIDAPPGVELAKSTATLDQKVNQRMIGAMPLMTGNTRDVNALARLAPTAIKAPGSTEIAVNGQRARNNNFMIDGVDNNDLSVTLISNRVIPEAISEYQVQTSAYSAEFGRNSGAQLSVITRSGTNQLHGEVFDYYRANWMEPVSLLNKRANLKETPGFVQHQAGGAIGGPIIKNRTFYFALIEANRRREAPDARNAAATNIPTPAGFAALRNVPLGPGQTQQSRDAVLQSLSFLTDVHPLIASYQSTTTQNINGVPVEVGNTRIPLPNPHNFWYWQTRIDHRLTDNDSLSYRLQLDKRIQPDAGSNLQFGSRFSAAQSIFGQNHALSYTRTFSPRFINESRMSYVRRNLDFPENDTRPTVIISNAFTIGGLNTYPQGRVSNVFQWQNVSTFLQGRHSLKFGVDIRRNRMFNNSAFDSKGTWRFNNLSDFMNNRANQLTQAVNTATWDARQTNQYYFFQDDFKATRNLTFNIGIRFEYSSVPLGLFGAANDEIAAAGVPRPAQADKNNWAPRFGFAYSPDSKTGFLRSLFGDGQTVFRGGFGMAYDVIFFNILTVNQSNYPRVLVSDTFQPDTIGIFPNLAPRQATLRPFDPRTSFINSPADIQNPTSRFYSFSIQRQFKSDYVAEIGYTGSGAYHGIRQGQGNPGILTPAQAQTVRAARNANAIPGLQDRRLNPAWGSRILFESTALANYNAMYLRLDKRLSRGLQIGANYTWSKNLSDNDESLNAAEITNSSSQVPQDFFNYRNDWALSVFDRKHRFVVHYNYEIPFFSTSNPVVNHIFKGWQMTGFSEWQSGQPFTIRTGVDSGGTGTTGPFRPDYNPNGVFTKDPMTGDLRTFTIPINGTGIVVTPLAANGTPLPNSMSGGGNLGKNTFRGPGFENWNFSLMKTIDVTERWKVQLRSDWINTWNHRNFGNPVATMNSPNFGANTTDPGARTMLLSAKIRF